MFSKVMKKMLALTLTLALVCSLAITTVNAEGGTNAQLREGMLSLISDYDDDATEEIASVSVENANADDVSVTMNVWTQSEGCSSIFSDAAMILKNISEDGLTVKFDFDLKGYYEKVKIGDFSFTTDGTAEISLGVDEEITIVLYSDNSNENSESYEWGKATLTLSNFVLTPFHICSADSHVMGEEPSCFDDGWKDYYMCRCEETFYADGDGAQQITDLEAWKQGDGKLMASHNYGELIEQNDGTHTADTLENGMKAHYFCDVCETYFTEEKVATTKDDLVIEVDHNYGELVEQNDGTHTADTLENGMKAHYFCDVCETYFTEEKVATTKDDLVIEVDHNYGELVEQNDGTHTADTLENGMKAHYFCDVCETYFTEEKVATTKDDLIIEVAHDYTVENGYIGDDGHANTCECGARGTLYDHIPDIPAPTETEDQKCSACGHLIAPKLGHIHENHLTKVEANPASCTDDGNIEYYECSCGKYFEDDSASVEITDKESVVIKAGHNYGELIQEEPAVHTAAEKKDGMKAHYFCDECDTYFTAEKVATTKDALVIANAHSYGTEWKSDKDNHWNECACGDKANSTAHNDENSDGKCDVCEYDVGLPTNPDNPQTGDNSMIWLWIALLFISGAGVVATTVFGKKRFSVK